MAASEWFTDAGAPDDGDGANGDCYLNGTNGDVYKKVAGTWGSPVGNIKGDTGPEGPEGPAGGGPDIDMDAYEQETIDYIAAMTPDYPDQTRGDLLNTFVAALKSASIFTKFDALWLFAAHAATASRVNVVAPLTRQFRAVETGPSANIPTFVTDRGWRCQSVATDNTGGIVVPAGGVSLTVLTQNSAHMGAWINSGSKVNGRRAITMGTNLFLGPSNASDVIDYRICDSAGRTAGSGVSTPVGHTIVNRSGASAVQIYKAGASIATATDTSASPATGGNNPSRIINEDSGGGTALRIASCHVGSSLSGANVTALYNALNAYLTAVGGN